MSEKGEKAPAKKETKGAPDKAPEKPSKQKAGKARPLPVLLEVVFTVSRVAIVVVCIVIAGISFLSGADLLGIFIRVGATLLGLGGLLWGITWFLTNGSIKTRQAIAQEEAEANKRKEAGQSTFEVKA